MGVCRIHTDGLGVHGLNIAGIGGNAGPCLFGAKATGGPACGLWLGDPPRRNLILPCVVGPEAHSAFRECAEAFGPRLYVITSIIVGESSHIPPAIMCHRLAYKEVSGKVSRWIRSLHRRVLYGQINTRPLTIPGPPTTPGGPLCSFPSVC